MTEADLYHHCKRFKINVTEMPLTTEGFYYRLLGEDFIAVDSRLPAPKKLLVLFHELGHFLFHTPQSGTTANFHAVGRRMKKECEADIFALCALIPRSWIESRHPTELIDDEGFSAEIVEARQKIFVTYGI